MSQSTIFVIGYFTFARIILRNNDIELIIKTVLLQKSNLKCTAYQKINSTKNINKSFALITLVYKTPTSKFNNNFQFINILTN